MFCPRCGTENELDQGYCRHCGQSLSDVRLALEGRATQSLDSLIAGGQWVNAGVVVLVVFTIIAVLIALGGVALGSQIFSTISLINLLLGAFIGLPLVFVGTAGLRRATRLLSGSQNRIGPGVVDRIKTTNDLLTNRLK